MVGKDEQPKEKAISSPDKRKSVTGKPSDAKKSPDAAKKSPTDGKNTPAPPASKSPEQLSGASGGGSAMMPPDASLMQPPSLMQSPSLMQGPPSPAPEDKCAEQSSAAPESIDKEAEPSQAAVEVVKKPAVVKENNKKKEKAEKRVKPTHSKKTQGKKGKKPQQGGRKRPPREKWQEGEIVKSKKFTWKIGEILGSGGFGDVYKVSKMNSSDDKHYAMKTEMTEGNVMMLRLKVEVRVMSECMSHSRADRRKHFLDMVDKGKNDKFKFLVMSMVGPSLEDFRRKTLKKNFSRSSAMQAALQTFQAVWDLHEIGWLHRDMKPHNFAIGLGDQQSTIFMFDFGIAKRVFLKGTKNTKTPRATVKFLGTLRFASRVCHNRMEQGRKDDVETWLYMVYDLFDDTYGLPWKKERDRKAVLDSKKKFFHGQFPRCYTIVPRDFRDIVSYLDTLKYADEPDYKFIKASMIKMVKRNDIDMNEPLDWVIKNE